MNKIKLIENEDKTDGSEVSLTYIQNIIIDKKTKFCYLFGMCSLIYVTGGPKCATFFGKCFD